MIASVFNLELCFPPHIEGIRPKGASMKLFF